MRKKNVQEFMCVMNEFSSLISILFENLDLIFNVEQNGKYKIIDG